MSQLKGKKSCNHRVRAFYLYQSGQLGQLYMDSGIYDTKMPFHILFSFSRNMYRIS
jgi:hypothetical protein